MRAGKNLRFPEVETQQSNRAIVRPLHRHDPHWEGRMAIHIRRREFITALVGATTWPLATRAQQPGKIPRLGILLYSTPAGRSGDGIGPSRATRSRLHQRAEPRHRIPLRGGQARAASRTVRRSRAWKADDPTEWASTEVARVAAAQVEQQGDARLADTLRSAADEAAPRRTGRPRRWPSALNSQLLPNWCAAANGRDVPERD
jgi:hypothetical protein